MTSYALDELPWPEVARAFDRDPRLLLPVGAVEQHGPHLPLAANVRIAEGVVAEVSQRLGILRAPTFSYGVDIGRGPFSGTTGLRRKTFHRAVNEILARWEDHGVTEFIIVTAHRFEAHLEALLMALTADSTTTVYDLYQIDVSDLVEGDPEIEHGGELETSLLLHLAPELVHQDEASDYAVDSRTVRKYMRGRVPAPPGESRGIVGHPSRATAQKGQAIFNRYVGALATALGKADEPNRDSPAG